MSAEPFSTYAYDSGYDQFYQRNLGAWTAVGDTDPPIARARSPKKQLFGENGWLGRGTSMKEAPDSKYRKTGLKHLGERFKQGVDGLVRAPHRCEMIPLISDNRADNAMNRPTFRK